MEGFGKKNTAPGPQANIDREPSEPGVCDSSHRVLRMRREGNGVQLLVWLFYFEDFQILWMVLAFSSGPAFGFLWFAASLFPSTKSSWDAFETVTALSAVQTPLDSASFCQTQAGNWEVWWHQTAGQRGEVQKSLCLKIAFLLDLGD